MVKSPTSWLLTLPPEILLRVLDHLYINQEVHVERELSDQEGMSPSSRTMNSLDHNAPVYRGLSEQAEVPLSFRMKHIPMGAQLIRTCRQLHEESQHLLYANNVFNCSQREGLKLLLQGIGPKNFSSIKHIVIDWEQLQDFAWSLAKQDYNSAMSGLKTVELATWRMRVMAGTSPFLREIKSYERQLCQSALDICEKHPNLKIVAQKPFHHRPGRPGGSHRVKWRFIASEVDIAPDESIVHVAIELAQLKASGDSEAGGLGARQMIDPF